MQNASAVILAQAIVLTVVVAISTSDRRRLMLQNRVVPGCYAELSNQC